VRRLVAILIVPVVSLAAILAAQTPDVPRVPDHAGFDATVKPFLAQTCYDCHNNRRQKGDVNLQLFETADAVAAHPDTFDLLLQKLRSGEMPPDDEDRPDPEDVEAVTAWVSTELDRLERLTPPDPGRVTIRRLNRTEYNNTLRDLLGVDLSPADDFPQDDTGYGFDTIADVLTLSPVLMERYMAAAERVARTAIFGSESTAATLIRLSTPSARITPVRTPAASYDESGLSLPNAVHATHRFPVDGQYMFRVFLGGTRPLGSEPLRVGLWIDGELVEEQALDPEASASFADDEQEIGGKTIEFRTRVAAGERWVAASILHLYEGLPARMGGPNPSRRPEPAPIEFRPPPNPTPERVAAARKRFEDRQEELASKPINNARASAIEVAGPFNPARGASRGSLAHVFSCGGPETPYTEACASENVTRLAARAFRRPVTDAEVAPYVGLVADAAAAGESFGEAMALAVQAVLVSPDFLFRIEQDHPVTMDAAAFPISEHELATRLSYFLWASMPDDTLRAVADRGDLRRPGVLEAQVRRMLADPRSRALVEEFGGQWLQFRALEAVTPDRERFPDFDNYLRLSMRDETLLFFETIVREDRSVLDFIDADYTYLNERLARHYGVPGVRGPQFRRVLLSTPERGGVLSHASVLTVSSYATRTSPVLRGKWILDNLLDAPPPDPPAGVPALDETAVGTTASLRQQMEAHRANPTCAACHRRMDPLGFGLENYDAIGAWRTTEGAFPIDASGALPDGRSFDGPAELRAILSADREDFTRALASKLLTYGLGRGLERYDRPAVRGIVKALPSYEYRFSGLVLEVVNSLPFQMRRGAHAP
jgi:mono/diheme cytochrome c family protein